MSGNNYDLSHYYDKLNEVFPSSQMTERAREAAIRDFTQHAQVQNLSIDAAIAELSDPERVKKFIEIGKTVDEYITHGANVECSQSVDHTAVIADLYESVSFLKDNVCDFIAVGKRTNEILSTLAMTRGRTRKQ